MFRAWDPQNDRLVTVKAIKLDLLPQQVIDVANALRQLAAAPRPHAALAQYVDAGFEGTTPFLVSECITGETLDIALRMLASAPLARAVEMLRPLADAVDASWTTMGGHLALHPRDVFVVDGADEIRVTGAGVVAALHSAGIDVAPRRPYAAPERSGTEWDQRADVYSVAAIAHELLTRRRPAGPQEQDGVFAPEITAPQRVAIRKVLARGLADRPEDRYATAAALVDALAAVQVETQSPLPFVVAAAAPDVVASVDVPEAAVPDVGPAAPEIVAAVPAEHEPAEPEHPEHEHVDELPESVVTPVLEMGQPDEALNAEAGFEAALVEVDESLEASAEEFVESVPSAPWRPIESAHESSLPLSQAPMFGAEATAPVSAESKRRIGLALVASVGLLAGAALAYAIVQRNRGVPTTAATTPMTTAQAKPSDTEVAVGGSAAPRSSDTSVPVTPPEKPAAPAARRLPRGTNDATPVRLPVGRLVVHSSPPGAMVTIDGRISGDTPLDLADVALGTHVVQVARPGYVPKVERINLTPTANRKTLNLTLVAGLSQTGEATPARPVVTRQAPPAAATPSGSGSLDLTGVLPRRARVIIDGERRGVIPMRVPELKPGVHSVLIELEGYRSVTTSVTIESGKRASLKLTLVPVR